MRRRYIKAESESAKAYRAHYQARKENARAKKAQSTAALTEDVKAACDAEDPIQALFELLVPGRGASKYFGGEIVRAMMRILYRDWNDGDLFYEGYGIETCGNAVAYLCEDDILPDTFNAFENIAENQLRDSAYSDAIQAIANDYVVEFIKDNPEKAVEPNDDDFQNYDGYNFISEYGWEPLYEVYEDYPSNILYHLDKGHIEERDIQWEVESWVEDVARYQRNNAEVHAWDYGVEVIDLASEAYEELDSNLFTWLENWGYDLDDEYGSEDDEEDEDDYEDEE